MNKIKVKDLYKCSECGSKPKKTRVWVNLIMGDCDFPIYQCSNKFCKWHLQPYFYCEESEFKKFEKTHKKVAKYFVDAVSMMDSVQWSVDESKSHWQKYHKPTITCQHAIVDNTPKKEEKEPSFDSISQLEV